MSSSVQKDLMSSAENSYNNQNYAELPILRLSIAPSCSTEMGPTTFYNNYLLAMIFPLFCFLTSLLSLSFISSRFCSLSSLARSTVDCFCDASHRRERVSSTSLVVLSGTGTGTGPGCRSEMEDVDVALCCQARPVCCACACA